MLKIINNFQLLHNFVSLYFGKPRLKGFNNFLCLFLSVLEMEYFKNIIHYESTTIISLPCIQLAKLKSCSVWCFSEKKKNSGDMGALGLLALPRSEALPPHTPLTRTKMAKISHFWLFIFLPPQPPSHPTPTKIIWCSHCISNLVLRLVKIFSGVKIHAVWRLVFKACKIFT